MSEEKKDINQEQSATQPTEQTPESPVSQESIPQAPMPMPTPAPAPKGWRGRMGQRMMTGAALITNSLPGWFATYAFATYMVALIGVNVLFMGRGTEWYFWLFGIAWVAGFFYLSVKFSKEWSVLKIHKAKYLEKKLFWTGFGIRVLYAVFIYFFYIGMTGTPHEFAAADSVEYIYTAEGLSKGWEEGYFMNVFSELATTSFSDLGYPLYILLPVRIFEGNVVVFVILLINAFFGAYTAVIVYRLTRRSMSETTARLAAIFCMLHPALICYVGFTLKEVFMTFLVVLYVNLADQLLRSRKYSFVTIAPMVLTGGVLFLFRTVLGMVAFLALFAALILMNNKVISLGRKIIMGALIGIILIFSASDKILRDVQVITDTDVVEVQKNTMVKRYGSEKGDKSYIGNKFANYAGAAVFAPLIFTIPFPTMVEATIGQEDMRLIHGGNWMRNVMSGFVILALFMMLLTGDWRNYTLPLAMELGYLVVLVFSAFAQSLRFHIPVMPFEMMFAAYALTNMRKKQRNWYLYWCIFTIVTCFAWNWFKLAGRGLA